MDRDEQLDRMEDRAEEEELGKDRVEDRDLGELGCVESRPGEIGIGRERREDLVVVERGKDRDEQSDMLDPLDGEFSFLRDRREAKGVEEEGGGGWAVGSKRSARRNTGCRR